MTFFSIGSGFWLCKICSTSILPLHPLPWAPPKSLIRNREERGDQMPWWGIIHIERYERVIWGAKFIMIFKRKSFKNPSYLAGRVWLTWFFMLALKNCDKGAWTRTSAMKGQHQKSRGLKFLKWSSKLRHWTIEFRIMKPSYSETGGPVLTPDFGKSNEIWIMKQSALCVNREADSQKLLPMKPEAW